MRSSRLSLASTLAVLALSSIDASPSGELRPVSKRDPYKREHNRKWGREESMEQRLNKRFQAKNKRR